jgi:hypothetical protein
MFDMNKIEREYINKQTRFLIEDKLLYSFSKENLVEFINETQYIYKKQELLYITTLNKRKKVNDYINSNELEKYYIEQIEFYFN